MIHWPVPASTPQFTLIARSVSQVPVTDSTAKAAVGLRESLAANSIEVRVRACV